MHGFEAILPRKQFVHLSHCVSQGDSPSGRSGSQLKPTGLLLGDLGGGGGARTRYKNLFVGVAKVHYRSCIEVSNS